MSSTYRRVKEKFTAARKRHREETAYETALSRWAQRSHYDPVGAGPMPDKPEHMKEKSND